MQYLILARWLIIKYFKEKLGRLLTCQQLLLKQILIVTVQLWLMQKPKHKKPTQNHSSCIYRILQFLVHLYLFVRIWVVQYFPERCTKRCYKKAKPGCSCSGNKRSPNLRRVHLGIPIVNVLQNCNLVVALGLLQIC